MSGRKDKQKLRLAEWIIYRGMDKSVLGYNARVDGYDFFDDIHTRAVTEGAKVAADNVVEYYWTIPDGKMETLHELPPCAPPWDQFFIETRRPPNAPSQLDLPGWGISVCVALDEGEEGAPGNVFTTVSRAMVRGYEATSGEDMGFDDRQMTPLGRLRWIISCLLWTFGHDGGMPLAGFLFPLDTDGKPMANAEGFTPNVFQNFGQSHVMPGGTQDQFSDICCNLVLSLLLSISFMHLKNVVISDLWRSPKERKAVRRITGAGPVYYRTVVIDPDMDVEIRGKPARSQGGARAMHLVRGHFVTYTEERPLGKYKAVGTFWRGAHFRGDRARGLVKKNYEVNPPKRREH